MVADAFKIADAVQQQGERVAVLLGEFGAGELDHVRAQLILIVVDLRFQRLDAIRHLRRIRAAVEKTDRVENRLAGQLGHPVGDHLALFHRERRVGEEALIQQLEIVDALHHVVVADGERRQPFQRTGERKQHRRRNDVERRMNHGDASRVRRILHKRKRENRVDGVKHRHEQHRADDVEIQVNQRRAPGVFACADGRNQRRDARADVLAHDNRQGRAVFHRARHAERLQNTDRSGRRLDDRRQHRARNHAQNRVGEHQQDVRKLRHIRQRLDRAAHHLHTGHQHGKADHDAARVVLFVALGKEQQTDADKRQNGRECRRFAQRQQQAVALQARQRKNPAGDRRADVRAHDDARRLREPHDAGVDEADHHHRRRRRRLDNRRHARAEQHGFNLAFGQAFQNALQLAAGSAGQPFAHHVHAV